MKRINKRAGKNLLILALTFLFLISLSSAYMKSGGQWAYSGSFSGADGSWKPDRSMCEAGQDFLVQIALFSCTPMIVRSDLLEEQNVPVFCQLGVTKINPLIKVEAIDKVSFSGSKYPKEIDGVGFHPAKAALGVKDKLNSPVLDNIGYAVIVLKKQANASAMPDFVQGTLNAKIMYNIENAYGMGKAEFYLPVIDEKDWEESKASYSFWSGAGYVRAESIDEESADIVIYDGENNKVSEVTLKKGEQSDGLRVPSIDECLSLMKIKLNSFEDPDTRAKLNINGEVVEVQEKQKFLEEKCTLKDIITQDKLGLVQKVKINCKTDDKPKDFELSISPRVELEINKEKKSYQVGEKLPIASTDCDGKNVFLGYVGSDKDGKYSISIIKTEKDRLDEGVLFNPFAYFTKRIVAGYEKINLINKDKENEKEICVKSDKTKINVKFIGLAEPTDSIIPPNSKDSYGLANKDFEEIIDFYPGTKDGKDATKTLGEQSFVEKIKLANDLNQKKTALEICEKFKKAYPNADLTILGIQGMCEDKVKLASSEASTYEITLNGQVKKISFEKIYQPSWDDYGVAISVTPPSKITDTHKLGKLEVESLTDGTQETGTIQLVEINGDNAKVNVMLDKNSVTQTSTTTEEFEFTKGQSKTFGRYTLKLEEVEDNQATINVIGPNGVEISIIVNKDTKYSLQAFGGTENEKIELVKIEGNSVRIKITYIKGTKGGENSLTLQKNVIQSYEGYQFVLTDAHIKKVAKVTLSPSINKEYTTANFSFKIGIEQRAIKLSPEKTKERIENIEKSIKEWEGKSEKLGKVVQGLKGACLATGLGLTVKNLFANTGGGAIARQNVMEVWTQKCALAVSSHSLDGKTVNYNSPDQCYAENADTIEAQVNAQKTAIASTNDLFKELKTGCTEKSQVPFLMEESVNNDCVMNHSFDNKDKGLGEKLKKGIMENLAKCKLNSVSIDEKNKIENIETGILDKINKKNVMTNELRDLYTSSASCNAGDEYKKKTEDILKGMYVNVNRAQEIADASKSFGFDSSNDVNFIPDDKARSQPYLNKQFSQLNKSIQENICPSTNPPTNCPVQGNQPISTIVTNTGKKYVAILEKSGDKYAVKNGGLYTLDQSGKYVPSNENINVFFIESDPSKYQHPYQSPEVKYYETTPYKGYPGIVPFDLKNGWYAHVRQTLPVFGNIGSYQESGRVMSLDVCNVGTDGIAGTRLGVDDVCETVNFGTGQPTDIFSGLGTDEARKIIKCAQEAVNDAQKKYGTGISGEIVIHTSCGDAKSKVGTPMVNMPAMQCADLMSASDCQILFNVCDPVICPSSRCNLGGAYPVEDVIQQGIIGGIALCLPNFNPDYKKGVVIPVCLTGIKAGIDGWISILTNHRDCLKESLATGKMIGICDKMYSIYACEFFWKQGLPLAKIAIPKLMERLLGQTSRGGGEYMGVQSAWDNAGKSVDFFANYYAGSSAKAFKTKIIEGISDSVCQAYASASVPEGGNLLDSLTQPASPPQFHGTLEEIPFTDATNPPISQYKVFYHIFAGKESRAYYQVYLRSKPGSSYYRDTDQKYTVAFGYIATGGYASETKDFTAPSGYKEMCIVVNGNEKCGFKEISTSFAVNYVRDSYIQEQASERDITTEKDCISGTASAYSLLNPNLQEGAEELIDPQLYGRGIIRICATDNPGKGTDASAAMNGSRWIPVGYCDDKRMKCWLDGQSVSNEIKNTKIESDVLSRQNQAYLEELTKDGITKEIYEEKIKKLEDKQISSEEKINIVNEILSKVYIDYQKAKLLFERGKAYAEMAIKNMSKEKTSADGENKIIVDEKSKNCNNYCKETENTLGICSTEITLPNLKNYHNYDWVEDVDTSLCDDQVDYHCWCGRSKINEITPTDGSLETEESCSDICKSLIEFEGVKEFSYLNGKVGDCNGVEGGYFVDESNCCCYNKKEGCKTLEKNSCIEDNICYWIPPLNSVDYGECKSCPVSYVLSSYNQKECESMCSKCQGFDCSWNGVRCVSNTEGLDSNTEELEDNFESPVFEFKDGSVTGDNWYQLGSNLYYKYSKGKWYWSPNEKEWILVGGSISQSLNVQKKNIDFLTKLVNKRDSYTEGLKLLLDRTKANNEGGRIGDTELSRLDGKVRFVCDAKFGLPGGIFDNQTCDEIFIVKDFQGTGRTIYFRWTSNWYWTSDNKYWTSDSTKVYPVGDITINKEIYNLDKLKNSNSFLEGAKIIFDYNNQ